MRSKDIDYLSNMEQAETMIRDLAVIFAAYYESLIKNNVPKDLAYLLTVGFADLWTKAALGENNGRKS